MASMDVHVRWECARATLDWYLLAAFRKDATSLAALARHLGLSCLDMDDPACGVRLLESLGGLIAPMTSASSDGEIRWRAGQARRLIALQLDRSAQWDAAFLRGVGELATDGQPLSVEAQVMVAGAVRAALPFIVATVPRRMWRMLGRLVGFDCPMEDKGEGRFVPGCTLACREMRRQLVSVAPSLRKRLIALHCPLEHLGCTVRSQTEYLSQESQTAGRNLLFIDRVLSSLATETHPLAVAIRPDVHKILQGVEKLMVPLPIPELAPGQVGYRRLPFCSAAEEPPWAPLCLSIGPTDASVGIQPVLRVRAKRTEILGQVEGYSFPGRLLSEPVADSLPTVLDWARSGWSRLVGTNSATSFGVYIDGRTTADRLTRLLGVLVAAQISSVRLIVRNREGKLGGLTVGLVSCPEWHSWGRWPGPGIVLWANHDQVRVRADVGPLSSDPYLGPTTDLAGLRERLERTRRAYKKVDHVSLAVRGSLTYRDMVRLLVSILKNSSGRSLYPKVDLVACRFPSR